MTVRIRTARRAKESEASWQKREKQHFEQVKKDEASLLAVRAAIQKRFGRVE